MKDENNTMLEACFQRYARIKPVRKFTQILQNYLSAELALPPQ